ncbi:MULTISPECIES: phage portal protein [Alphaproteobacteria]|uniref:Portal protein n=2 Tax=Alphaproteobacteria TaxID=28211 RepID=A0A512HFZ7_9HYPH|nr:MULTISPECIES: phage portal protein [Alphaproteobacteria]GEO84373.1 portal protein [Ciceribacter naphthalenivorans]GLR22336.1 portal protein [Ciceribacter naphthalenivorans]GLT05192.1 portal protein [Sphingomonas psychrolutea]
MKLPFRLPWALPAERSAMSETKASGSQGFSLVAGEGEARWSGRSYPTLSREGFMKNPVAHRTVRLVAEAAAAIPWLAYRDGQEVEGHAALALVGRPNAHMGGADFFEALYGHLLLSGNSYVEALAIGIRPAELHLLRPDRVSVVAGADGWPQAYDYRTGTVRRRIPAEGGEGLLHLKLFHPLDDHIGFPPLAAAQVALDLHNAAARWNKALLDNSARPSGALVYQPKEGGNLSADQYERLKSELDEGYSGPMRAGRPLLLEGGLDWKSMGLSPKDMDFVEARNGAARDIALAFGVPPMLLGIPGDNTYANYQEANRAFYRLTVLPLVSRTAASFSGLLSTLFGEPLRLVPDLDQVAGLAAERDALWARLGAADFLTEEEKRQAVGY